MWERLHYRIFDTSYCGKRLDDHALILEALRYRNADLVRQSTGQHLENVGLVFLELSDVDDPAFDAYLYSQAVSAD